MQTSTLLLALKEAERRASDDWLSSLPKRKLEEAVFHDTDRDNRKIEELSEAEYNQRHGNKKFYSTTDLSTRYIRNWIAENGRGRVVLDYACGNGHNTLRAAEAGAELAIGLDISPLSIRNCRQAAEARGLANTFFLQGDCENTGLPDNSVDVVICSGMLHHLDLSYAFPELRRIMKPGGRLLAIEALNYNPVIRAYRNRTPEMRTEWEKEHILDLDDVRFASRFFDVEEIRYWHLFSPLAAFLGGTPLFETALKIGNALDACALRLPGIQLMAWTFTFVLVKRQEA